MLFVEGSVGGVNKKVVHVDDQACNFLLISYFMLTYYMQTLFQKTEAQFLDSNNQISTLLFDLYLYI